MNKHDTVLELSVQAIGRMPYYLDYLNELYSSGVTTVSAPNVAAHFGFSEIQVRKDFSAVSSIQGRPKHGFSIPELIDDMEMILGYRNCKDAVLVGAGSLGTALLEYDGFNKYGIDIVAAKHLSVPDGILVQNENMAASLALLSKHLMDEYEENKA